ncbi:hypothetical protein PIB30_046225 [Stylosanthes scabra]|uniref:Reverse transcriptase zinc-binding domain-containing protein n=1 Tax=Stylosanthes scabra TaxID=79078 RepID=A0ABU6SG95_9FABA|nr:hypothetical protein [Stylosanthes scabra]
MGNDILRQVAFEGWRPCVGNGKIIKFWVDRWIREVELKEKFPRLFRNSLQKNSVIDKCGYWGQTHAQWCGVLTQMEAIQQNPSWMLSWENCSGCHKTNRPLTVFGVEEFPQDMNF